MSQREYGRRFGVSQNMISLYEKGRSRASVEFYVRAAKFGNKTIEWLLAGCEDRAAETLHEMRDLHDKMSRHLAIVRQLLDRETESALDSKILSEESPAALREMLLEETDLPRCLRTALESPELWNELSMNGREVWVFRIVVRLFGSMDLAALREFLDLVRHRSNDACVLPAGQYSSRVQETEPHLFRPGDQPDLSSANAG